MFAEAAAGVAALSLAGSGAWLAVDMGRRAGGAGSRMTWWSALALALVLVPALPGPGIPIRVERTFYEGPDLLSGTPEETAPVSGGWVLRGVVRDRTVRVSQGGVLLRDVRRVEFALPWLLLAVSALWLLLRPSVSGARGSRGAAIPVLVCAGLLQGCGSGDAPGASLAEVRLQEVMEMRRTGDVAPAVEVFDPVAVWEDYPNQVQHRGLPEIVEYLQQLHRWAGGVFLDVTRIHAGSDVAVAEWVLEGVQTGSWPGMVDSATYRRFRLEGVTVVEVERGVVVRVAEYTDMVPLVLGLGGSVTLPGGEVVSVPQAPPEEGR